MVCVFNLISTLALKKKTFTQFYFSTNMDYFEGKNYNHADNAPKYIVFMACNVNIASIEAQLY